MAGARYLAELAATYKVPAAARWSFSSCKESPSGSGTARKSSNAAFAPSHSAASAHAFHRSGGRMACINGRLPGGGFGVEGGEGAFCRLYILTRAWFDPLDATP
jgi:hypothetical protein